MTLREMTGCGEVCGDGSAASVRMHRCGVCGWCDTRRRHCCVRMMSSLAQSPPLLNIPHMSLHLSPDSISTLSSPLISSSSQTHPDFPDETRLSTPVSDSHDSYMALTQRLAKAFTLLTHTLHVPLLSRILVSLLLWGLPFTHSSSPFVLPSSLTYPIFLYNSSDPHRPHLERRCSTRPTRVE